MKRIRIDVMLNGGGRFYKTLIYQFNPIFKFDFDEMCRWVLEQLPSLRQRKDVQLVLEEL